jgi:hypothetical protein
VPPLGGIEGQEGVVPPLLEPLLELPPELLPEPPPLEELPPELPPLELELPPELPPEELLPPPPELLLELELPPELLPPSVPPSVPPVNVAPPQAHIVAAAAAIQSLARMSRTSRSPVQQGGYQEQRPQFRSDASRGCAAAGQWRHGPRASLPPGRRPSTCASSPR